MSNYKKLPIGDRFPEIVNAVIEIPYGDSNKYEFDPELGVFKLDRVLHSPMHYPADYGFIPSTHAQDGDPLDILVLISRPTFTGCVLEARPIGILEMSDNKGIDEKVLAIAASDPRYQNIQTLENVEPHLLKEIEYFFSVYKSLEGLESSTYGWKSQEVAFERIRKYKI